MIRGLCRDWLGYWGPTNQWDVHFRMTNSCSSTSPSSSSSSSYPPWRLISILKLYYVCSCCTHANNILRITHVLGLIWNLYLHPQTHSAEIKLDGSNVNFCSDKKAPIKGEWIASSAHRGPLSVIGGPMLLAACPTIVSSNCAQLATLLPEWRNEKWSLS